MEITNTPTPYGYKETIITEVSNDEEALRQRHIADGNVIKISITNLVTGKEQSLMYKWSDLEFFDEIVNDNKTLPHLWLLLKSTKN